MADKPKQFLFISNRDITVSSLQGMSLFFAKGTPTHVPASMHAEVMEKGILPCDVKGKVLDISEVEDPEPKVKILLAPEDPQEREKAVYEVVEALAEENDATNFSAGGVPLAAAVTSILGWKADAREVRAAWDKYRQRDIAKE